MCIKLNHFTVKQKLTQHCKSRTLQKRIKKRIKVGQSVQALILHLVEPKVTIGLVHEQIRRKAGYREQMGAHKHRLRPLRTNWDPVVSLNHSSLSAVGDLQES